LFTRTNRNFRRLAVVLAILLVAMTISVQAGNTPTIQHSDGSASYANGSSCSSWYGGSGNVLDYLWCWLVSYGDWYADHPYDIDPW